MLVNWKFQGHLLHLPNLNSEVLGNRNQHLKQDSGWFWCPLKFDIIITIVIITLHYYCKKEEKSQTIPRRFFLILLAWFPRSSTGLDDHFPLKVKIKVQFQKWQGCRSEICSREKCQRLRGFGKGARMIQHWAPLDYEDITLISLVIRMIATICLTHQINDSLMPVCGFLSSQLFFTDLNSFWRRFRAWEIIRNSLVSPPGVISWILLILSSSPHSSNSFLEMICYQPSSIFL